MTRWCRFAVLLGVFAPLAAQELPADWGERDLEGKWTCYRADCVQHAADPDRKKKWAALLGTAREFELLELLGTSEGWRFAGPALAAAQAPQTYRVALWNCGAFDSHNKDAAEKILVADPGKARQWFDAYPSALAGKGAAVAARLAVEPARGELLQLPPLDPMQVLVPFLDAPAELAEFGDRLRAEPKAIYLHQVLRALDGVLVYGDVDAMLVPKVVALGRHRNAAVRTAAFATLTKLPAAVVPDVALLRLADGGGGGDDDARRGATVALSYAAHPRAYFALLRIAAAPDHPGAEVARARLLEIGDPSTGELLRALAEDAARAGAAGAAVSADLQRLAGVLDGKPRSYAGSARAWLERAAWLRIQGDPRAAEVARAVLRQLFVHLTLDQRRQVFPQVRRQPAKTAFAPGELELVQAAILEMLPPGDDGADQNKAR